MKSMYDVTFADVTEGMIFIKCEVELKDMGATFIGYTDEFYDSNDTGFYSYRIYELGGKQYIADDGWKFRDQ